MRNYIGISEFKHREQVYKLDVFDDEYFIILRNNQPVFIAFPSSIDNEFDSKFKFHVDIMSARDLTSKSLNIKEGNILHIIKDNKKYYNIIPFGREESCFIEETLINKTREKHLSILKK